MEINVAPYSPPFSRAQSLVCPISWLAPYFGMRFFLCLLHTSFFTVSLLHCPVLRHQTQRLSVPRHMNGCRREIKEVKAILVYLNSDVGSTKNNGGYKRHKPLFICTQLLFIIFLIKMITVVRYDDCFSNKIDQFCAH
jgi:hypothetical protein